MSNFCLPRELTSKFLSALKSGELDPAKLADMTSAERHAQFSKVVGENNAGPTNALFESKLLLKNQQAGIINWAKSVGGLKPEAMRDLATQIQKMERILSPEEQSKFLEDLAAKKLGTEVTFEEAQKITEFSRKAQETKAHDGSYPKRVEHGHALLDLHDYVESLKGIDKNIVSNVANIPKTVMSTFDLSAPLRQGWGMMSRPQFYSSFANMFKYAASKNSFRELQADIISRPTYPLMKKSGLRISSLADKISQREEQFMSNLVQKIPGIGASERAYVGFLNKLRADVFDSLVKSAELRGEDIRPGSQASKEIANVVNDFTGSGNLGKGDKYANAVPALNATFFSPRKVSATVNMLNPQRYLDPRISPTARRAAIRQLVGSLAITTTAIALARMAGADVETDPTSSDFAKAKFGKTRYDFTGGNGTYAVLLARLIENQTKSSTSGKVTKLGEGYKPTTRADLALKFARNKLSPSASFLADWLYESDSIGTPFDASSEALQRAVPLIGQDVYQIHKEDPGNTFGATLGSLFGVGVQEY